MRPKEVVQRLWRYGRSAQTGALLQMLTNRANFSILARSQAGLAASGIYSIAYYGLEAMWLVPRALAPLVYTRAAAADSKQQRMHSTTNALWKALLGTLALLIPAVLIPDTWYEWAFGFDGIQPVIWSLAPAAVCGAVASIVAHHLSGIGQHRWNAWTSGLGLVTLAWLAQLWVTGSRGHWSGLGCIGSSCGTDHWLDAGLVELRKVSGLNPIHQGPVGASSETPLLTSRRPIGPLPRRGRGGVPKTPGVLMGVTGPDGALSGR